MKAFVVGNIVMDESFSVHSLPAGGESIFGKKTSTDLGGKGTNQAIILGRCGVPTVLVTATGADAQADAMIERLSHEPVEPRFVRMEGLASDTSIIMTDQVGGNTIVTTTDCARALTAAAVRDRMTEAAAGDMLILQGNLDLDANKALIRWAQSRGLHVAMNPSPYEDGIRDLLAGLDLLFLNENEAERATGQLEHAAVKVLLDMGIATVVLTMGARGALLGTASGIRLVPACDCPVIDSTGAGDTFQSVAIAASLARGRKLDATALSTAAEAAALTVSRPGTAAAFPTVAELAGLMHRP